MLRKYKCEDLIDYVSLGAWILATNHMSNAPKNKNSLLNKFKKILRRRK